MELTTDFLNHFPGCASHGPHCQTAEEECGHGSDECSDEHFRIHKVHLEVVHEVGYGGLSCVDSIAGYVGHGLAHTVHGNLYLLNIRCEQSQSSESR